MKLKLCVILITCLYLFSCNKTDTVVYRNKAFEDMCSLAKTNNSPFCIVLSDSSQIFSNLLKRIS